MERAIGGIAGGVTRRDEAARSAGSVAHIPNMARQLRTRCARKSYGPYVRTVSDELRRQRRHSHGRCSLITLPV